MASSLQVERFPAAAPAMPQRSPARPGLQPLRIISVIAFATVVIGLVIAPYFEDMYLILGVALSVALCLLPLVLWKREPTLLAPVYICVLYVFIAYPLKLILFRADFPGVLEDYPGLFGNDAFMTPVVWMFILGLLSYYAGFYLPPKWLVGSISRARIPARRELSRNWPYLVVGVYVIGWLSLYYQTSTGRFSTFSGLGPNWDPVYHQVLTYLWNYTWFGFIGAAIWLCGRQRKDVPGILTCTGIIASAFLMAVFFLGFKTWLVFPFFYVYFAMRMQNRRPSRVLMLFIGTALLIFAFAFVPAYRENFLNTYKTNAGGTNEYLDSSANTLQRMQQTGFDPLDAVATFVNRMGGMDGLAQTMNMVPEHSNYAYFESLISLPIAFIPRAIWPTKPTAHTAERFTWDIAGMTAGGSASAHPVAEGYLNYGAIGVVVVCWIWGVFQVALYRGFYLPRRDAPLVQVIYGYYMLYAVGFGSFVLEAIVGLIGQFVTMIPLILLLGGTRAYRVSVLETSPCPVTERKGTHPATEPSRLPIVNQ